MQQDTRLPYLASLDGLRALAVSAVLLYHADLPLRGGFLGVEIFFVLSGFLITALLLGEWLQKERIDLRAFWVRRARRLLPALVLALVGTMVIAATLPSGEVAGIGGDMLAALAYVMNWHLILSGHSYFDAGVRPSLLQHLWSLAIEEQFYLLWPLLVAGGLRLLRLRGLLISTLLVAGGSMALAATLYDPGADPSRIYYGLDTRAGGLLIGAALAMLWAPWRQPALNRRSFGIALDIAGVAGLIGLLFATINLFNGHPLLYRGGLTLVALATALVIAAATHPRVRLLPMLLSQAPLRWLGRRSYGIYLWHWPIFQVTRPYLDLPFDGPWLTVARISAALLMAELSYRFVEEPIRRLASTAHRSVGNDLPESPIAFPTGQVGHAGRAFGEGEALPGPPMPEQLGCLCTISSRRSMKLFFHAGPGGPRSPWSWIPFIIVSALILSSGACSALSMPPNTPPATPTVLTPAPVVAEAPVTETTAPITTPTVAFTPTLPATATPLPTETASATATATATATPLAPAAATATAEAQLPPIDPALAAALQAVLDRTIADGYIPGAVVAVNIPGRQTWIGASGLADRGSATPMSPQTRVRIASISKTFTAVVVMQLVEEGRLSLDDPLAKWLPGLVPDAEAITIRNLLQHTSGLYDYLEDRSYANLAYGQPDRSFAPGELVAYAARFPKAFRPGAQGSWDYSSTNYVILGMVVETVTGNSLAVEMRRRIFEPLGLEGTFFMPDEVIEGPFATGYARSTIQRDVAMSFAFATANLVSTVEDVQRFARALFAGELVSDQSREQMLTFVNGKGQYNMPELAYGLGVMRNTLPVSRAPERSIVYGHIGGFGGFRSAVWHAPESGITIALGVNQASTNPNTLAEAIFRTLTR